MTSNDQILKQQLEKLFHEHYTPLVYFAQKYLGDIDTCKDIVHNVFVKIWENRNEFEFEKPAKSYLFTAVYNRSMNAIRDSKKFANTDNNEVQDAILEQGDFSDTMEVSELEGKINSVIESLPEKCKQIFKLNRFQGKKYAEIADELNISVKTVEAQMSKALKILKQELKDYLYVFMLILLKNINF